MKQSCVSAFARVARTFALAAVALAAGAGSLLAQAATGKIEGTVRDQQGAPIANAQVFIVGTRYGGQTNASGYYFINNVPAGLATVRATFIGYKTTQVADVRVQSGQTMTVDVTLEATPFQVEEIVTVAAVTPLVPRDEVTSKQRVDGGYTDKLPVDRITNVLALQPGVVASTGGGTLSIRGGRPDETAVVIDGVPVGAGNRATGFQMAGAFNPGVSVGTNAFEDASITTGASSAEFGGSQSGVISITTRTGGSQFSGSVGYESDELFGTASSLGFNRVSASLGGPIVSNLTFFLSGVLEGQKSAGAGIDRAESPIFVSAGIEQTVAVPNAIGDPTSDTSYVDITNFAVYTGKCDDAMSAAGNLNIKNSTNADIADNYGVECQGVRIPTTNASTYQLQGKLNFTYGTGSRISFTALGSQNQARIFNYGNIYNPQSLFGSRGWSNVYTLNWTQNLAKSAERALALDVSGSYQTDKFVQSPLTAESELDSRDAFGGFLITPLKFRWDLDNFPLNQELLDNFRWNIAGSRRSPYDLENTAQYTLTDEWRNNAYGLLGFTEGGGPTGRLFLNDESRWVGRANLDWQVDRYNRVKIGGDYTKYDIKSYSSSLTSQAFSDFYMEEPIRWAGFVEDRLDLGDVVVVGGVRYDFYDSRASRPTYCDPVTGECQQTVRISTNPANTGDFDESFDLIYKRDDSHEYLSPHIQVSFPVTERTNFRLSYAHQVQAPDFGLILGGINTDLAVTNTNHVYGADLDFGKTITFEFGIRHAFNDDMVLDLAAYNKDNLANAAGRLISTYDPLTGRNQDIRTMTNADFGNTRGVDIRLDRRFGNLFNGTLAYSFQDAKNTGSDPFTYINFGSRLVNQVSGGNQPPPQAILPTASSRPHNLAGSFSVTFPGDWHEGSTMGAILQDFGVFATFRVASGTAFTRCPNDSGNENVTSGQVCDREFTGDVNGARLPTFKQLDMRFTKGFGFGGMDLTAYLDARNILNLQNITTVFSVTNDVSNSTELQTNWAGDSSGFALEAAASGERNADGSINLTFGTAGCGNWVTQGNDPAAPNCVYLIRAEERWGDGDGTFTVAEQRRASDALYYQGRGLHNFTSNGRRLRLGLELNF
ncbi:MAG TPA: TonB-dependent receptor [Gemmatimonadales bacterium]|nr:TonB-dependent receptor [Gemmatimonadales bacterium]